MQGKDFSAARVKRHFLAFAACIQFFSCGPTTSLSDDREIVQQADCLTAAGSTPVDRLRVLSNMLEVMSQGRSDPEELHRLHSQHIERFWRAWHHKALERMASEGDNISESSDLNHPGRAELDLLATLFADPMPARSRTLLYVLGDTLISLSDRLSASAALHDFSCKVARCDMGRGPSEFAELVRLLAALPDQRELDALLKSGELVMIRPEWRAVFTAIAEPKKHCVLRDAVMVATGAPVYDRALMTAADTPPSLMMLASALSRCQRWRDNWIRTGMFESDAQPRLSVPLNHERLTEWGVEIRRQVDELASEQSRMANARQSANASRQGMKQREREQLAAKTKLEQVRLHSTQTVAELQALRAAVTRSEMAQTFAQDIEAVLASGAVDAGGKIYQGPTLRARIAATHARRGTAGVIESWAVPQEIIAPLEVAAGDIVTVTAQGMWSPTCALRTAKPGTDAALAGPEGFGEQLSDGKVQTFAVRSSRDVALTASVTQAVEASAEACVKSGASFFGSEVSLAFSLKATAREESGAHFSSRSGTDEASLTEQRTGAAFSVGLRLPNTPFPSFPAGSLLMALEPADASQPPALEVVRPQMEYLAPRAGKIWFVVNDATCAGPSTPTGLDLQVRSSRSVAAGAKQVTEAMSHVIADLARRIATAEELKPSLLEVSALRSELMAALVRRGVQVEALPSGLATVFQTFMDKALANWERKVAILDRQRGLQSLRLEEGALQLDAELLHEQRRLNSLATIWADNEMNEDALRFRTERLLRFASETLLPALKVAYPDRLAAQHGGPSAAGLHLTKLRDLPLRYDFLSLSQSAREIVAVLLSELTTAQSTARAPGQTGIALVFERPGQAASFAAPRADAARSASLWRAIENGDDVTITVRPDDFYTASFYEAETLRCSHCAPVTRSMRAYFIVQEGMFDNRTVNASSRPLQTVANSDVIFATRGAPSPYTFAGATFSVPVKMGDDTQVRAEAIWRDASGAGVNEAMGLSPFSSFTFSFRHAENDNSELLKTLKEAAALVILFDVETQSCTSGSLNWIPACR